MSVNAINPTQSNWTTGIRASDKSEQHIQFKDPIETKKVDEPDSLNVWKELTDKYDVKNTSFEDIVDIANSLYKSGEISLKEVATMTFDFGRATQNLKQSVSGVSSNFSMYETSANVSGKRNWIEEFEARASKHLSFGNLLGHSSNKLISGILQKLERE